MPFHFKLIDFHKCCSFICSTDDFFFQILQAAIFSVGRTYNIFMIIYSKNKPCLFLPTDICFISQCREIFANILERIVCSCFLKLNNFIFKFFYHIFDFIYKLFVCIYHIISFPSWTNLELNLGLILDYFDIILD